MKILYFSPHPHINMAAPSGPGTHIREVIEAFEAEGHEVVRFIQGGEKIEKANEKIAFKKRSWKRFIPSLIWETLRDLQMIRLDRKIEQRLVEYVAKEKPDIIYERSCYGMGAGLRAAQKMDIRYVVEMNAPYPEEKAHMQGKSLLQHYGTLHEKKQVLFAHRTIVVSTAMRDYLMRRTEIDVDKILVVANAVNPAQIVVNTAKQAAIRAHYNLTSEVTVFGFVGSIFPYHGVDIMIESFHEIVRDHKDVAMLIVGDGEVLPQLQERVTELGLEHTIHFTGNVPHKEVYNYLSVMDVTVMARSNWYGSPVKIFEYGAMKKAIIAPKVVPVLDVMQHEIDGLLIEANVEELSRSMQYMLHNPERRQSMAAMFHEKVMREHTWKCVAEQILLSCQ
jgi:glycosyltransferase involved in cell wall biosynthesis